MVPMGFWGSAHEEACVAVQVLCTQAVAGVGADLGAVRGDGAGARAAPQTLSKEAMQRMRQPQQRLH